MCINSRLGEHSDYRQAFNTNINAYQGYAQKIVQKAIAIAESKFITNVSKQAETFLKSYEAFSSTVYDASDGNGDWTIGYGHKTDKNAAPITKEQASKLFSYDLKEAIETTFVPFLRENGIILTQNQFDAMVSFTFNFGDIQFIILFFYKFSKLFIPT